MLLMTLPTSLMTCNTSYAEVPSDIRQLQESEVVSALQKEPPINVYVYYETPKAWGIVNPLFWNDINKKLNDCKARKDIVDPEVKKIIENPQPISWYQEKAVIPWLVVGGFVVGVSVPVLIFVFARR